MNRIEQIPLEVPADLLEALAAIPTAQEVWLNITPIARRDFISWIDSAKQSSTRARRVEVACSKLAAGQRRPCCYAVIPLGLYKALGTNQQAKAYWKDLSSDQRRDFANWIESAENKDVKTNRVKDSCEMLAAGKLCPS